MRTYRLITRPKLDYGSIVYGSANRSSLNALNVIPNNAMRMGSGAFKTSPHIEPADSLQRTGFKGEARGSIYEILL